MYFGNWVVTEEGISWNGGGLNRFAIARGELNRLRQAKGKNGEHTFYDWILLATSEDWLTQNDLYDLNYAFVYAIALFGLEFDYDIFDATLAEQFDKFEIEDAEDLDL